MKFSVCLPTGFEGVMNPIGFIKPEEFVTLSRRCEALGYDSVWGNDHVTTQKYVRDLYPDTPPNFYEPLITLSFVAQATTRLKVGTALLVLPMRDPVYLAKQVATLDQLSGGRFILGIGVGAYREEFEAWNTKLDQPRRGDMVDEGLAALHALLTERRASFDGNYYGFRDVEMYPKPVQDPFALWVGGHNLEAVRRAATWGQGWLPGWRPHNELAERIKLLREQCEAAGRPAGAVEVAPQFGVTIDRTVEAAEKRYFATGLAAHRKSLAYTGRDLSQQATANFVGSPDAIRERVAALEAIGVDHCCALMFPTDTVSEFIEQVQWFAETVMPGGGRG